jgi:Zn-dependent peptidase ImmA (M78 family)/transcriptional regulator with XRE-family HTH domain
MVMLPPMLDPQQIGARLMEARQRARLTEDAAADAAGLTRDELEACEAGRSLTSRRLSRIAEVYGLSEEELASPGVLPETAVSVLLRGDPQGSELARHLGRFASICRERTRLEDLLGAPARGRVPSFAPAGEPTSPPHAQGEALAKRVRQELDLGLSPIRSMTSLLVDLGVRLVWTDRLDESMQGISLNDPKAGPSIVANVRGRQKLWWTLRSTLAHELCHVLFDRVPAVPLGIASRRAQREPVEQRANAFGIYFLAPREGVARFMMDRGSRPYELDQHDVRALMMHFGLGKDAATFHLMHLDWVTAEQRVELMQRRYPTEPEADVESPEAQPGLSAFIDLGVPLERLGLVWPALAAYSRGLITQGRFREALELDPFTDLTLVLSS